MDASQIFQVLAGQGGGFVLAALFFWMLNQAKAEAIKERERYIAALENQIEEFRQQLSDENEKPTRIVRPKKSYVR